MAARKGASRRQFLELAGVGVVGLAAAPLAVANVKSKPRGRTPGAERPAITTPVPAAPPVPARTNAAHAWLGDLVGKDLGPYRVASVGRIERGGVPVEMTTTDGVRFRVDVLRFDATQGLPGIGTLGAVSVYLRNGGKGGKSTDETQGLGAMALADELSRREREGITVPAGLWTMGERARHDASAPESTAPLVT